MTIRPANMRSTHGLRTMSGIGTYSRSAAMCMEEHYIDPMCAAVLGSGMDAPQYLPIGSIKAFSMVITYFCQRTVDRETGKPS